MVMLCFLAPAPLVDAPFLTPLNDNPCVSTQYVHSYHTDILQADIKNLTQGPKTVAIDTLAPNPLWPSAAVTGSIKFDNMTFLTTDPLPLTSTKYNDMHDWYIKLCQQTFSPKLISVPCIVSKRDMLSGHKTCLPQLFFEMGSLLLLQSLKRSVLDLTNEILHRLYPEQIAYCGLKLAGYYFLNALLPHAINSTSYTLAVLTHFSDLIEPDHVAVELASY